MVNPAIDNKILLDVINMEAITKINTWANQRTDIGTSVKGATSVFAVKEKEIPSISKKAFKVADTMNHRI